MLTVARALAKVIKSLGVDHVFGVPGKSVVPTITAFSDEGVSFVLARQESGAGFMASGYALARDTLGVVIGTSGPGGSNMLTAAAQAMAYNAPVLFITGAQAMLDTGKPISQDSSFYSIDLVDMFKSVTKFSAMVQRAELFETYLRHALDEAFTGSKGAVHLSLPFDVQREEIWSCLYERPKTSYGVVEWEIDEAIEVLESAKRPAILAGKGVKLSQAYKEIITFAERFKIPVITTPGGKGAFPSTHELSIGPYGLGGCEEAKEYLQEGVDLLVVMGSRLSDFSIAGMTEDMYPEHVLQFDINRKFVGRSLKLPTTFVSGDLKTSLGRLLEKTEGVQVKEAPVFKQASYDPPSDEDRNLYVADVLSVINSRTEKDDNILLFADMGSNGFISVRYFNVKNQGSFVFDDYLACMGSAIGCSIGSQIGDPSKRVICVTGDGSFYMLGTEISTAAAQKAPVIFIVVNNERLDMVYKGMSRNLGRVDGTEFNTHFNIAEFARSMGVDAFRVYTKEGFANSLDIAFSLRSPAVIEVMVDKDEPSFTEARG